MKREEIVCCTGDCLQGRDCPLRPRCEQQAKDFDHNEGPGILSSRWFWGSFAVSVCLVSLAAWAGLA